MTLRRFKAKSRSRRGHVHELVVSPDGRVLSCACEAWRFGKKGCRHARRLAAFLAEFEELFVGFRVVNESGHLINLRPGGD